MLHFSIFGFRISVHWIFWLLCLFIAGGTRMSAAGGWPLVVTRMIVIFFSILVHELGHAFAGRHFGARPSIEFHGLGGLTRLPDAHFTRKQHILVTAAGPAFGLALGLISLGVYLLVRPQLGQESVVLLVMFDWLIFVNFFWTALNLLPIQPMDGGQILREALGPDRLRLTCTIGAVVAAICTVLALMNGQIFIAVLLGAMAYSNFTNRPIGGGGISR